MSVKDKKHLIYYHANDLYIRTYCGIYLDKARGVNSIWDYRRATCKNCKRINRSYK